MTVVEYKKAVYVCKNCDKNGIEGSFKTAEGTPALIEKSLASPSILAYIMNQKYSCAMPLFRQEQELKQMGVKLSRQTMANWMIAGANLLKPLYEKLRGQLISEPLIHADETPVEVLYCDGWTGYDKVENAVRCGCWVHLRRYFVNAFEIQPDKSDFTTPVGQALLKIREIFRAEKLNPEKPSERTSYTLDEIAEIRKEKSAELVADFFDFCEKHQGVSLPKSLLGKAFTYALNQRKTFEVFLTDPRIELTNNAAERAVKPFVIGRKNWLFCYSPAGAQASAVIYSIIETAKANNKNPQAYLEGVFEGIRLGKAVDDLLPWNM